MVQNQFMAVFSAAPQDAKPHSARARFHSQESCGLTGNVKVDVALAATSGCAAAGKALAGRVGEGGSQPPGNRLDQSQK